MSPDLYLAAKALHLIALVAWFAGLFYIFRLFVYHVRDRASAPVRKTLTEMESKLLRIIMLPAMCLTIATGSTMLWLEPAWLQQGWIYLKLTLVACLLAYHGLAVHVHKRFAAGQYVLSERACRIFNELPTLVLVGAVILVVFKPF